MKMDELAVACTRESGTARDTLRRSALETVSVFAQAGVKFLGVSGLQVRERGAEIRYGGDEWLCCM